MSQESRSPTAYPQLISYDVARMSEPVPNNCETQQIVEQAARGDDQAWERLMKQNGLALPADGCAYGSIADCRVAWIRRT